MAQQIEMVGGAPQVHGRRPCEEHHERYWGDIDAEQIDLDEFHAFTPMSKYSGCLVSTSETTRMIPRQRKDAVSVVTRPVHMCAAMRVLRIISVPSDSCANTWSRCSGVACSGMAESRRWI